MFCKNWKKLLDNNTIFTLNISLALLLTLKLLSVFFWTLESIEIRNLWWFYTQDPRMNIIYNIWYTEDTFIFGYFLYKSFFFIFLFCSLLLLISMVCSLILILRSKKKQKLYYPKIN